MENNNEKSKKADETSKGINGGQINGIDMNIEGLVGLDGEILDSDIYRRDSKGVLVLNKKLIGQARTT
jgi:hypothetical protein